MFSKLQYISQGETAAMQLKNINEALDAGCNWVQLRFKNARENELQITAEEVKKACDHYGATFIINDHPEIAKSVNADGVHLGLTDMKIAEAKNIIGTNKILGGTANILEHVLQRVEEGCSYVGLGPFRFTPTKEKLSPVLGLHGYKIIMAELETQKISTPVYAIGGIVLDDVADIMQTGVHGIAVSGTITNHSDKKLLVKQFNTFLYGTVNDIG